MARHSASNPSLTEKLKKETDQKRTIYEHLIDLDEGQLAVAVTEDKGGYNITLLTDIQGPLILHWGAAYHSKHEWVLPPVSLHPPGTAVYQNTAAQTPFKDNDGYRWLSLNLDGQDAPTGILFVLKQSDTGRWIKEKGQNFFIPVAVPPGQEAFSERLELASLADKIIESEMGRNSWTLMHRFNLCYDLLDRLGSNDVDGVALIYVWLRFSYIRQLDWQRNYNTKPRELGHAISRLTDKLAARYIDEPAEREFIRLIMTTLGTGRDAQRVRDEILNIMHRHDLKETAGHFMEEWHQKLHNNATPDDIVICEAYLEFLASNGNIDLFYKRLEEGGVTRKRLESYERPIRSQPVFIPHLKEALMHDFEHFLEILREVHAGADLGTATHTAGYLFDADMHSLIDYVLIHRNDHGSQGAIVLEKIIEARRLVAGWLSERQSSMRDLLFLDLALEDFFRAVVEKNLDPKLNVDQLAELTVMSLENLCISTPDEEFESCLAYWKRLGKMPLSSKLRSLQARAVVDRLERGLGNLIDRYHQLLQPKAESLGKAFHAASWSVSLFTEEVVRGRPAFVLSLLLRKLDALLRKSADIGNWQVISLGSGTGVIETVSNLKSIQGKRFTSPTVIVADDVEGNEEIPEGVIALITPASVDVLSHLAVRARNSHILFAVCYNPDEITKLKLPAGGWIKLGVSAGGEVLFEESREELGVPSSHSLPPLIQTSALPKPFSSIYALTMKDFNEENTGGKSNNLRRMQGKLPDWIHLPASAALPFGVFEKVLAWPSNKELAERHNELLRRLNEETESSSSVILEDIKKTILALESPDELFSSLCMVMESSGVGRPEDWPKKWEDAWTCIKLVWGSKWNERAYLSRKANGIPHEYLMMAVLVQRVVEADYSFVVHTVNPFTNDKDNIYAEVVLGLGETLVANYPGRALSFSCVKGCLNPQLSSFPGKSVGLFGGGLVFRSDSNGEDLAGFAGAGLYDSFMLPEPVKVSLNYTEEPLVWDDDFRNKFLLNIAEIGVSVEKTLGGPQDIEGAYAKGQYYVVQARPQAGLEHG
jgi:alpha-glucan,water dikinase